MTGKACCFLYAHDARTQFKFLNSSPAKGEVIYQHDDETSAALVETMRHLAGKAGAFDPSWV